MWYVLILISYSKKLRSEFSQKDAEINITHLHRVVITIRQIQVDKRTY
jgi:hypothetical protein